SCFNSGLFAFDGYLARFNVIGLVQSEFQHAIFALGPHSVSIHVLRQRECLSEAPPLALPSMVADVLRLFRLALAAQRKGSANDRDVQIFGFDPGNLSLHVDRVLVFGYKKRWKYPRRCRAGSSAREN